MTASEFPALRTGPVEDGFERTVTTLAVADLPEDGAAGRGRVVERQLQGRSRGQPGRPGRADLPAGARNRSGRSAGRGHGAACRRGTAVLAHGYEIGVSRHGGFAGLARVPGDWLVEMPVGLGTREAMVIGTAGFTAAQSVVTLEDHGLTPEAGPVLVTGASGGVGSMAVSILAGRGYEVVASTGKESSHEFLRSLGASEILDRSTLRGARARPWTPPNGPAAVDCVGGVHSRERHQQDLLRRSCGGERSDRGGAGSDDRDAVHPPRCLAARHRLGSDPDGASQGGLEDVSAGTSSRPVSI